jgi:polysaccharide pyruvyl transferase WcaK-like protein
MRIKGTEGMIDSAETGESRSLAFLSGRHGGHAVPEPRPRIALLTPYTGGNLGDAAIQDALIANLRLRLPGAQFSGISLNSDNFVEQHGMSAFPLCRTDIPFYGMGSGSVGEEPGNGKISLQKSSQKRLNFYWIKRALKRVPVLGFCLKIIHTWWREFFHWVQGYRFLRNQDVLFVSGGGQLNEQCGGPWGQPLALFKWAVLARIARIPYVIASVGVGNATSRTSRFFLSSALRMAAYRSYRDKNTRAFAAGLLQLASEDPVVPDLALSLPPSEIPRPAGIRSMARGRTIIAVSPIIYAKPPFWPSTWFQNRDFYERYVGQMANVVSLLLKSGCFLVFVYSSLGDDQSVVPEILERLDEESRKRCALQVHIPAITTWTDLVGLLRDVDFLIASRLHSAILGFVAQTPTIAISYDRKVDWIMEELGQTGCLLQMRDFVAEDVIRTLERIQPRRNAIAAQIASYLHRIVPLSDRQYDALAELALTNRRKMRYPKNSRNHS